MPAPFDTGFIRPAPQPISNAVATVAATIARIQRDLFAGVDACKAVAGGTIAAVQQCVQNRIATIIETNRVLLNSLGDQVGSTIAGLVAQAQEYAGLAGVQPPAIPPLPAMLPGPVQPAFPVVSGLVPRPESTYVCMLAPDVARAAGLAADPVSWLDFYPTVQGSTPAVVQVERPGFTPPPSLARVFASLWILPAFRPRGLVGPPGLVYVGDAQIWTNGTGDNYWVDARCPKWGWRKSFGVTHGPVGAGQ